MRGGQRDGAGRPAKDEPRNELLQVRISRTEKRQIEATAEHHKMSVSELVRVALGLAAVLLVLAGCGDNLEPAFYRACESAADCAAGEVCPVETGVCAPTCVDYDDCYGLGDGHCAYLEDGPACVWHCSEDAPEEFICEGLEDEGSVLVAP